MDSPFSDVIPFFPFLCQRAFALKARIPNCELKSFAGSRPCQIEQPWLFDRFMIEFLPSTASSRGIQASQVDCLNTSNQGL